MQPIIAGLQVVKYCSDRRHAKNPHAKTTKERLDYYKGLLKALKVGSAARLAQPFYRPWLQR